jgi:Virulence-associated protein E/RepB DNA-primase from phage plasmid
MQNEASAIENDSQKCESALNPKQRIETAQKFLDELGKGLPEDQRVMVVYAKEATPPIDENGKPDNSGFWAKPCSSSNPINPERNAYVMISSSVKKPRPKTGEMRYWRAGANFGSGLALMVDDIGNGNGGAGNKGNLTIDALSKKLPPTVIVETSPNNFQCWYFFDAPVTDKERYGAFLYAFAKHALDKGGDKTIKDITRIGRFPIGINNKRREDGTLKYPDANGEPFQVRQEAADYGRRYRMDEIAQAFGFEIVVKPPRARTSESGGSLDERLFRSAIEICTKLQLGEASGGAMYANGSEKYRMRCPWGDEHSGGKDGAVLWGPEAGMDNAYAFVCSHDTCQKAGRTWSKFVDDIIFPVIENEVEAANEYWAHEEWPLFDAAAGAGAGGAANDSEGGAERAAAGTAARAGTAGAGAGQERQQRTANDRSTAADGAAARHAGMPDAAETIRRGTPGLVERGAALARYVVWPHEKTVNLPDGGSFKVPVHTVGNFYVAFDMLFGRGKDRPHFDTFKGRIVDHEKTIFDDHYPKTVELMNALDAIGLRALKTAEPVKKAFAAWCMVDNKRNSLIERLETRIPKWDGVARIEMSLISTMKCSDRPENRAMGRYFWLSLAARIFRPGAYAPIVLCLIGAGGTKKTFFVKYIEQQVFDDPDARPTPLNYLADENSFVRCITGYSIIANVGEFTGYSRAEITKIKDFTTRETDDLHYKFEGNIKQKRQWIVVMDANGYDGLQRDPTGNRRFYPMFVRELPRESDGKPNWIGKDDIGGGDRLDFTEYVANFWQYWAEAKYWLDTHTDQQYVDEVDVVLDKVKWFNAEEIKAGRGAPPDPILEIYLNRALAAVKLKYSGERKINGKEWPPGIVIYVDEVHEELRKLTGKEQNVYALKTALQALPRGTKGRFNGNRLGFFFERVDKDGKPSALFGDEAVKALKHFLLGDYWDPDAM